MDDSYMIGKMNTFMHQLGEKMSDWLGSRLPKLTDNWWSELVYSNLSPLQRDQVDLKHISELKGLDLAALLRVFDRNWFVITSSWFVNNKERQKIKDMMGVRNSWAHITSEEISKEKVISDVEIIIELMQAFDASMSETKDMEVFIMNVEDDADIQEKTEPIPVSVTASKSANPAPIPVAGDIAVGSLVTLVSDPSKA
ncbi:Swt1 family HEPN domain-containing protein, partial [[Clostridium] symbiosum]